MRKSVKLKAMEDLKVNINHCKELQDKLVDPSPVTIGNLTLTTRSSDEQFLFGMSVAEGKLNASKILADEDLIKECTEKKEKILELFNINRMKTNYAKYIVNATQAFYEIQQTLNRNEIFQSIEIPKLPF